MLDCFINQDKYTELIIRDTESKDRHMIHEYCEIKNIGHRSEDLSENNKIKRIMTI